MEEKQDGSSMNGTVRKKKQKHGAEEVEQMWVNEQISKRDAEARVNQRVNKRYNTFGVGRVAVEQSTVAHMQSVCLKQNEMSGKTSQIKSRYKLNVFGLVCTLTASS